MGPSPPLGSHVVRSHTMPLVSVHPVLPRFIQPHMDHIDTILDDETIFTRHGTVWHFIVRWRDRLLMILGLPRSSYDLIPFWISTSTMTRRSRLLQPGGTDVGQPLPLCTYVRRHRHIDGLVVFDIISISVYFLFGALCCLVSRGMRLVLVSRVLCL